MTSDQNDAALDDLLRGVIAAPEGIDPNAWMALVQPPPDEAARERLRARKIALAAATDDGLGPGPAPRARLDALRAEMVRRGLDGFIVPRADAHHSEYLPRRAERLRWLTGFAGSAGLAVVLARRAAIFIDGRYTLQVRSEVDGDVFEFGHLTDDPADRWLAGALPAGAKLGYDPWLHTPEGLGRYRDACAKAGAELVACDGNPIDAIWDNQPPPPISPLVAHGIDFAGESAADKRARLAAGLRDDGIAAAVISAPESIAWLLNVRGADVPNCPMSLAFAILHDDGRVDLFIDRRKLVPGLDAHLGDRVSIRDPGDLGPALDALAAAERPALADRAATSAWIFDRVAAAGGSLRPGADPCALPKARKNPTEVAGARAAHRRDGVAMARFLAWLDATAPGATLTEIAVAERLAALRAEGKRFRGLSFPTIAGAGPDGAIVHYRAHPDHDRRIEPGMLLLLDSGAQYLDGTTDIIRTIAIGTPSAEQRRHFTAVLKGHIALATARFPAGTSGSQLDGLARAPLWRLGLDYDHGTGHGVGSYLGVHEGPQRIAKAPNRVALEPGMICSNEPGYYRTGAHGIRIENLVTVIAVSIAGADRPMLGFETLTLAPIDRRLIDPAMLVESEIAWLDRYHARVRDTLAPTLDAETATWLAAATRPLGEGCVSRR